MYCQTNWVNIRKRIDIIRTHVTLTKHLLSDYTAARRPKSSNGLDWNRSERNSCMLQCTLATKATQRIASDRTSIKTFSVVLPSRSENTTCSNVKTVRYLPLNGYSRYRRSVITRFGSVYLATVCVLANDAPRNWILYLSPSSKLLLGRRRRHSQVVTTRPNPVLGVHATLQTLQSCFW